MQTQSYFGLKGTTANVAFQASMFISQMPIQFSATFEEASMTLTIRVATFGHYLRIEMNWLSTVLIVHTKQIWDYLLQDRLWASKSWEFVNCVRQRAQRWMGRKCSDFMCKSKRAVVRYNVPQYGQRSFSCSDFFICAFSNPFLSNVCWCVAGNRPLHRYDIDYHTRHTSGENRQYYTTFLPSDSLF